MWSSSHIHGPRRSHDQGYSDTRTSRSSSPDDSGTEGPRRRTSSDATPRQAPMTTRFLDTLQQDAHPSRSMTPVDRLDGHASSKRLGFLADKLGSSLSGTAKEGYAASIKSALHAGQLLHPHSHSRVDSSSTIAPSLSSTVMASSNTAAGNKSPSKPPYGRTYDPKLVSREMQRLGNLSGQAPQLTTAPSVTSLALPPASSMSQTNLAAASTTDPWGALHVHVLPLFNGEPLRIPIEDLNNLVKRHIQLAVSSSPAKAVATLESDASELIANGMVTLNAKLNGIDDDKLISRVVEIWGFFLHQVLTYLEGVLLPLQIDPLLLSLYQIRKRPSSPTRQTTSKASISSAPSSNPIDVRSVALKSFRDRVILPVFPRLYNRLSLSSKQDGLQEANSYQQPLLQQMLLVLSAQNTYSPPTFSISARTPPPAAGETAIKDLLRLVRSPRPQQDSRNQKFKQSPAGFSARTSGFFSGALPRDRRGRVVPKSKNPLDATVPASFSVSGGDDPYGDDTPRMGMPASYAIDMEREREREFLEVLRSTDLEPQGNRLTSGGWGLGAGNVESIKTMEDEDDDTLDWDQAQAVVERRVGINALPEMRRRMT